MFYLGRLYSYRVLEYRFHYPDGPIGNYFLYIENINDIVNIQEIQYQQQLGQSTAIEDTTIRARINRDSNMLQIILFVELNKLLQFKAQLESYGNLYDQWDVFIGFADLLIIPATHISTSISFLPTYQTYDQIWVKDATYNPSHTYFLETFDFTLWLAFIGSFILCIIMSRIVTRILDRYVKSAIDTIKIIGLILNQGLEIASSISMSNKIIMLTLALLLIVFVAGFEAFLSSLLAIKHISLPFNDLNSVFIQNEYTFCMFEQTAINKVVEFEQIRNERNFKLPTNTKACSNMSRAKFAEIVSDQRECDLGKVVFISSGDGAGFRKFSRRCNLTPLPGRYVKQDITMIMNPGFQYREDINRMLIRFRTAGILKRLISVSENQEASIAPIKSLFNGDKDVLQSISFYQVHLVLLIFVIGVVLFPLIIMLIEIWHFKLTRI